jgi:hypothetical protein
VLHSYEKLQSKKVREPQEKMFHKKVAEKKSVGSGLKESQGLIFPKNIGKNSELEKLDLGAVLDFGDFKFDDTFK